MSHVDVDTVNERLNGLVALLQGVGVGGDQKQARQGGGEARPLDDDQIAAIIQTLKMAEAPQIIAALEAKNSNHTPPQQQQRVEEEDDSDDDEDDDDANYPMVGPGCSDDISVVSDLTTPTVVQGSHVPDEEHYRDTLPPLLIVGGGGPMLLAPTKRKNLVGSVRANTHLAPRNPNAIKPPSSNNMMVKPSTSGGSAGLSKGAAAQRRKAYNATMERLAQDPSETGSVRSKNSGDRPSSKRQISAPSSSLKPQMSSSGPPNQANFNNGPVNRMAQPPSPQKVKKAPRRASMTPQPTSHEWPEWSPPQNVDENGFLMTDPFAVAPPQRSAPRKATSASDPKSSLGGDMRRVKKPTGQPKPMVEPPQRQHFVEQPSQARRPPPSMLMGEPPKPSTQQRRSRRASLAM